MLTIHQATPQDAAAMADVERQSWPPELAADAAAIACRVAVFPAGQLLAEEPTGRVVGAAYAQRIRPQLLARRPATYEALTDGGTFRATHCDDGEIYQLISVGVIPAAQGVALGRRLVDRQLATARSLPGVRRIVGFTRPAGYAEHAEMPIEEYVQLRDQRGRPADATLAFHLLAGARVVAVHADFRPPDTASRGYGVLIEYALDVGDAPA